MDKNDFNVPNEFFGKKSINIADISRLNREGLETLACFLNTRVSDLSFGYSEIMKRYDGIRTILLEYNVPEIELSKLKDFIFGIYEPLTEEKK